MQTGYPGEAATYCTPGADEKDPIIFKDMRAHFQGVAELAATGDLARAEGSIQRWMRVAEVSLNCKVEDLRHDEASAIGMVYTLQNS